MRRLIRSVLLLALAVAVVALLLWYGDAGRVASTISRFRPSYLIWYLLLLMAQEVDFRVISAEESIPGVCAEALLR